MPADFKGFPIVSPTFQYFAEGKHVRSFQCFAENRCGHEVFILAEGAMTLPVTLSGGVLFAS